MISVGGDARPRPPMREGYLVQNRLLYSALKGTDLLLGLGGRRRENANRSDAPRRVLLAIGGHLGDVVIGSAMLPTIRAAWPQTEIGLIIGSWAAPLVADHPEVRWVHFLDHWKLNRGSRTPYARAWRHFTTRRRVLREIRKVGYDLAIDSYPFFPNAIPVLWRAGIPTRIGYSSGGFGPLLTSAAEWQDDSRHIAHHQRDLLKLAGIDPRGESGYALPPVRRARAGSDGQSPDREYVVIHMGAGTGRKEWPRERWRDLVKRLSARGHTLVFTGNGASQDQEAELVMSGLPLSRNFCNRQTWQEFAATIAGAEVVVCVDSVAGHLAAAVGTPVVVLMAGMSRTEEWRPLGERVVTLTSEVPCAPCFRSEGCAGMECVREVKVDEVLDAVVLQLDQPANGAVIRSSTHD